MGTAADLETSRVHGPNLPGWLMASLLAHLLVLSVNDAGVPTRTTFQDLVLTADLRFLEPESMAPAVAPGTPQRVDAKEPRELDARPEKAARSPEKSSPPPRSEQQPPADTYFGIGDVESSAEPSNEVFLRYPWIEYRLKLGGVVRLTLFINEQGGLDKVILVEAAPPGHFEEAALEAVNQLRFTPALKNGRPVKSRKTIEVVFDPSERLNHPAAM